MVCFPSTQDVVLSALHSDFPVLEMLSVKNVPSLTTLLLGAGEVAYMHMDTVHMVITLEDNTELLSYHIVG